MPERLTGKVALVTGASSGIGRATALLFAQESAMVVSAARRVTEGQETVAMIKALGGAGVFVQADITQAREVEALVGAAVRTYGRLDCAFNNAGVSGGQRVRTSDFSEETFDQVIRTNVKGTWLCMKYELQQMLRQGHGAIVNCASVMGLRGLPAPGVAYVTSKHAIVGMTKAAAPEYATDGVRVNAVCPGSVLTEASLFSKMDPAQRAERAKALHPMGRLATPEEVAEAAVWLCSEGASFITGQALPVDGGWTAR